MIVLNSATPGFETSETGKPLAWHADRLKQITDALNISQLDAFVSQDFSDFGFDIDTEMPEIRWFDPQEGIDWATTLVRHIRENPETIPNADDVIYELEAYLAAFKQAAERGLKWHLEIDI